MIGLPVSEIAEPSLVPELLVSDLRRSLEFWCGLCGFTIAYRRPAEGFAYITLGGAHLMLEERGVGRNWLTGDLQVPFGRGINFQIGVAALEPILAALRDDSWPLYLEPEVKWYRVAEATEVGVRQFLVADPDGYLVRFQTSAGTRRLDG
ncbi:bleomycin resistance protein [Nocardia camponoti]|uniref:Bleomycin resistance protein n=1 Tax=Nocardia camponoti TaxID=1616106 RepID=A0A917QFC4_9NOCA|nr:VOC family protein [Nocardia camponoti]GGK47843.1 aldoketomutase [Nocardia camponoti]